MECCKPGVCFDFGFQKGCSTCKDLGVADDCTHDVMKGMCKWDEKNEKCMMAGDGDDDEEDTTPFENFAAYQAAARKASPDACKDFQGKQHKKKKTCAPPKNAKKFKCKKVTNKTMCSRTGCTLRTKGK